ncbi:MAG: type III-A CRISPR-associated protein Csm2 [Chloroflexi bacterium]|nr:type III-A CRISPR-associated protein Csm2 [Chloroflexota bacterium]
MIANRGGPRPPKHGEGGERPFPTPSPAEVRAIIVEGDAETLVQVAERVGRALVKERLTTSQIRAFFGAVREIEMSWPPTGADPDTTRARQRELLLLRPKLAYQAARASGQAVERLRAVLDPAIAEVRGDRQRFQHFVDFFEAILAYHRAAGGRD